VSQIKVIAFSMLHVFEILLSTVEAKKKTDDMKNVVLSESV